MAADFISKQSAMAKSNVYNRFEGRIMSLTSVFALLIQLTC